MDLEKVVKVSIDTPNGITEGEFHSIVGILADDTGKGISLTTIMDGNFNMHQCAAFIQALEEAKQDILEMMSKHS